MAWLATVVFLDLDFHQPCLSDDAFELVMDVARGSLEVEAIADLLRLAQVNPAPR